MHTLLGDEIMKTRLHRSGVAIYCAHTHMHQSGRTRFCG